MSIRSDTTDATTSANPGGDQGDLFSTSFIGLLLTQFLGAANDNILRWLVIAIGKDYFSKENIGMVLMAGTACFVLPYLFLAAPAGYLADRFSKRTVIVACKLAEIVIMVLAVAAIVAQQFWMLLTVVALMGGQSALFGPAKFGSIPEMLKVRWISAANGLMGLISVVATVIGMWLGSWLYEATGFRGAQHWWLTAVVLVAVAAVGSLASLGIKRLRAANPLRKFPWDAPIQTARDLATLAQQGPMLRVALGIMFFWSLAALAQLNIDQFVAEGGARYETDKVPLLLSLVVGLGVGSVLAGIWSAGRVELGILPLGAAGVAVGSLLLFTVSGTIFDPAGTVTLGFILACTFLLLLGTSAGLFNVPLESYMQHRSPTESRGAILAASNFMTFSGILIVSLLYAGMRIPIKGEPLLNSRQIFLVCGLITIPVMIYIIWLIPQATIRFMVWLASKFVYRIRVYGHENLPERGGALLVANHVSWLDGVLLLLTSSRPIRMFAHAGNFRLGPVRWAARLYGAILVDSGPKSIRQALRTANEALKEGELVCIFPEGAITRSGQLQTFRPGLLKILDDTGVPVVPVYLDELWGSIFSFRGARFFWKWPEKMPYPISIFFGPPVHRPEDIHEVRQAVAKLGASAVQARTKRILPLPRAFVRNCKRRRFRRTVADSSGTRLSGGNLLMRSLVLRRLLRRNVLSNDELHVGILLPPSVGAFLANMTLGLDRRTSVNLNYTASSAVLNHCIAACDIRHVLTSRKFVSKMSFDLDAELVYLEDFKDQLTVSDKMAASLAAYVTPARCLEWLLGLHRIRHDDVLTVVFTSGSEGVPKGVMLSHGNVGSNVEVVQPLIHLGPSDVLVGILPFFHSFGYSITMWTVATLNARGVYHYSPLDAKRIGKLTQEHGGTVLLTTPTFLRTYLRRCTPEQLATLEVVIVGAEKMPLDLFDAYEKKFGHRPVEGYGTTELSPLVSVNIPASRSHGEHHVQRREGTVGRPIAGVSAKVVDLDTGEDLSVGKSGMLLITGPNVMLGYLGQPEKTAEVMRDGWYVTGDIAVIDEDGFISITGRESRFSKIGGEMVPHIRIETVLNEIIFGDEEQSELKAAVTAVPDPKKGERLVVVHTALQQSPQELCEALTRAGLPNIFVPSPDSFTEIDEMPVLGSGKLDLKGIKRIALERFHAH
jgi:acyl-[acyl-carrier-protein]-phospholipid O-acyltransferase/long-chain-fatty-acid--[acyl-carrier-protein] ligase